jgi:hypothetical protein
MRFYPKTQKYEFSNLPQNNWSKRRSVLAPHLLFIYIYIYILLLEGPRGPSLFFWMRPKTGRITCGAQVCAPPASNEGPYDPSRFLLLLFFSFLFIFYYFLFSIFFAFLITLT